MENTPFSTIDAIHASQKAFFATGATLSLDFRKKALKSLKEAIIKWEPKIAEALVTDLHKSHEEGYLTETGLVLSEISDHLSHLKKWARRERKCTPLTHFLSSSYIVKEPLGCSLIVSPWNYPVQLLLNPLVGAISAGCTALLKPSPYVPTVSTVIGEMIAETFPSEYIACVQGNREVNGHLLSLRFDMIFFTGSPSLGRKVMAAASNYLTPVVLELGGKSPCIVDKEADIKMAARRVVWGKCLNSGQTCIAPDYLFVHEDIKDAFVKEFGNQLSYLYKDGLDKDTEHFGHIVKDSAFERLKGYLSDGKIIFGGHTDAQTRFFEPTILEGVSPDAPVMTEEIFGPIFPLNTFKNISEVKEFVSSREKPLAFYYFGKEKDGWKLISETSSGGACINDTIMHIANPNVPFGGVGGSGMGSYHAKRSFDAFTHERSVIVNPTWIDLPFRYMPYKFMLFIKMLLR